MQLVINNYSEEKEDEEAAANSRSAQKFSYEQAVEMQKQEGGPRRFYGEDEGLDTDVARITDEHGNPVKPSSQTEATNDFDRDYVHIHVSYCIG